MKNLDLNIDRLFDQKQLLKTLITVSILSAISVSTASAISFERPFEPEPKVPVVVKPKPNNSVKAYDCLNKARANHTFTADRPAFSGSSFLKIRWNIKPPSYCSGMLFKVDGKSISATGSMTVVISKTTTHRLEANYAGFGMQFSTATVPYVKITTYRETVDKVSARAAAVRHIQLLLGKLKEANKRRLQGWKIELHIIPASLMLTDLPAYAEYAGDPTDRGNDGNRTYDSLRGAGGIKIEKNKIIRMAVGEEQLLSGVTSPFVKSGSEQPLGYILAHEMGHTILGTLEFNNSTNRFVPKYLHTLSTSQANKVIQIYRKRQSKPLTEWLGVSKAQKIYLKGNPEEYFGDSVAAYFRYPIDFSQTGSTLYRPDWLRTNDREMYDLLRQIFD